MTQKSAQRLHVSLDEQEMELIAELARRRGLSLSMTARDLLLKAIALEEDMALSHLADSRLEDGVDQ